MTDSTHSNIKAMLCSDVWSWDPEERCSVKFNEDGTGQLLCSVEFTLLIASEFDWEILPEVSTPEQPGPVDFVIALTLSEREFRSTRFVPPIKPTMLNRAAFRRKEYHLRLEKGSFKVDGRTSYGANPTYEYKLLWDKSPYPPLEEWNIKRAAAAGRYWELKDFYKGALDN